MGPPTAVLTTHYWHPHVGGIETVARHHLEELTRRGWHVDVHTSRIPREAQPIEALAGGTIHRHRAINPMERFGVPTPLSYPGLRRALDRSVAAADVVVAHGHLYPITASAARAAGRHDTPLVIVQHNPWVDYPAPLAMVERMADRSLGRWVLENADLVICVSEFTRSYVEAIAPRATTEVIGNGVDNELFRPATADEPTRAQFVCVRRLVRRNGVDVLIRAWELATITGYELVIIGDGPEAVRLRAAANGVPGIRFEGWVDDATMADSVRRAYACVVPTRSGEGFGLAAAEAHAAGVPVVATAQGALPEVVTDGVDGVLSEPEDPENLAVKLVSLASDAGLRDRLAAGARRTDRSWRSVGSSLDQTLRSVADVAS